MFKQKRVGNHSDPLIDQLEARRRRRRGIPDPPRGTAWSGSGTIEAEGVREVAGGAVDVEEQLRSGQSGARFVGLSDVGRRRQNNEDSFFAGPHFAGVCDGLGGAAAGEVASRVAAQRIASELATQTDLISASQSAAQKFAPELGIPADLISGALPRELALQLRRAVEVANRDVHEKAKIDPTFKGMATTATAVAFVGHHLFVAQVGDSRAYLLRRGELVRLTRDQSCVAGLIEAGKITEKEVREFKGDFLTQAVGSDAAVEVALSYVELRRGDLLLLCSDGLHDMLWDDEIQGVLQALGRAADLSATCQRLVAAALQAGGRDNVTVVVGRFDDAELCEPTEEDVHFLRQHSPIGVQI